MDWFNFFELSVGIIMFISLIIKIAFSSLIIQKTIENTFKEDIDNNHNQHLLLSISTTSSNHPFTLSFGSSSYYTKSSVQITKWKGQTLYTNELDISYSDLLQRYTYTRSNKCEDGYKKCGILDTAGNILCLPTNQDCPINDIIITNTMNTPNAFSSYKNAYTIKMDDTTYLHYTNEATNNLVLAEFAVSKKKPCLKDNKKDCEADESDPRFTLLDKIDEYLFYKDNELDLVDKEEEDESSLTNTLKLYYRGYIGYNSDCMKEKNFWENINFYKKCSLVRKLSITVLVMTLFLFAFSIVMGVVFSIKGIESENILMNYSLIIGCPISLALICIFACLISAAVESKKNKDIQSCSDDYFSEIINKAIDTKDKNEIYIFIMLGFESFVWLLLIIYCVFFCSTLPEQQNSSKSSKDPSDSSNPPQNDPSDSSNPPQNDPSDSSIPPHPIDHSEHSITHTPELKELPELSPKIDINKIRIIKTINNKERIIKVILLNDGRFAAITKKIILIYSKSYEIDTTIKENNEITSICQLDSGQLVTSHTNKVVKIRLMNKKKKQKFNADESIINNLISLSGNRFASSFGNKKIKIWMLKQDLIIDKILTLENIVDSMYYDKKNNYLLVTTNSNTLYSFDENYKCFHRTPECSFVSILTLVDNGNLVYANKEGIYFVSLKEIDEEELSRAIILEHQCNIKKNEEIVTINQTTVKMYDIKKATVCFLNGDTHSLFLLENKIFVASSAHNIVIYSIPDK